MLKHPRRHFLGWDRPLLPQAVEFLADGWTGSGPLDLSRLLVIVPTRQSGRRLREALANFAATRASAVFAPRVMTPEALVAPRAERGMASRLDVLLAWTDVLRGIDLGRFREVFPVDPPARNFAWALRLAEQLSRVQATLRENGLRIGDVLERLDPGFGEAARWEQLAELERREFRRLADAGLRPPEALAAIPKTTGGAAPASAAVAAELAEIDRVVVLATPDPLPALVPLLETAGRPVDVLVFAPGAEAAAFDPWGRPVTAAWEKRTLPVPDFAQRVHLCSDPAEQAVRVAGLAVAYVGGDEAAKPVAKQRARVPESPAPGHPEGYLAVGLADPEILPLLEAEADRARVRVFNPEGRVRRGGALYQLLLSLAQLARSSGFDAVEALARCPDILAYLSRNGGPGFSAAGFLSGMDELRKRHLPAELADARRHACAELEAPLAAIAAMRDALTKGDFPHSLAGVLADLFSGRRLDPSREEDAALQDEASAWTTVLGECTAAAARFGTLAADEWFELALRLFGDSRRSDDKPAAALELQGWLELLFEDAPHLVVAGFNDGFVPEAVAEDAFLPESLRARLGLKTNAARFARDAYLLEAVASCRRAGGRLDLLYGKTSASGDPLRPSRLLLRCADHELPERVARLFRAPDTAESHLPWTRAWQLEPRVIPAPRQVAVTSLRRWLACPFRFYLKYALRMEAVDAAKTEMDAFDFGTLCHAALEAMGADPVMRDCTDAGVLREFLLRELTRHAHVRFGTALTLPLMIQLESARQRLGRFAEVQARERGEGWVIEEVERSFTVSLAGVDVKGKIDRIDRNERTGAVRVLDYKTSDTAVSPWAAHVRTARPDEQLPPWAGLVENGKRRAWADLQLPLYRHALASSYGGAVALGYINLPKAVGQTALSLWEDYVPELHEAAMACAHGVCAAIAAAEFWPPNEDIRTDNDEFGALFHHGVAASVAWEAGNRGSRP